MNSSPTKLRTVLLATTLVALLGPAASASGKGDMIVRAKGCGISECNVNSSQPDYLLLNPAIETGRAAAPPSTASASFRITLFMRTFGSGRSRIVARYHPDAARLHVLGRREVARDGSARSPQGLPFPVPRRWVVLDAQERVAYDALTSGLEPTPTIVASTPRSMLDAFAVGVTDLIGSII